MTFKLNKEYSNKTIQKNSRIYDYTGIDLIIRNNKEVQTFEQLKNIIRNEKR